MALLPLPDCDMGRPPANFTWNQMTPSLARTRLSFGLGDDRGIRAIAARQAGERPVAGAFLFRHGLEIDRAAGFTPARFRAS